jgi:hypothetical protein
MSNLAYHLWESRGRPFGSPEVDWFLAEKLVNDYLLESPFDEFVRKAVAALSDPTLARGVRDDVEYARVMEERRYVIDVLDRVKMLAFAYSRLNALSGLYRDAEAQMDATKRVAREEPLYLGGAGRAGVAAGLSGSGGTRFGGICLLRVDQLGTHAKGFECSGSRR